MVMYAIQNTHEAEVPLEVRVSEGRNEPTRGSVNMNENREPLCLVLLAQKPINFLDILVLASIGSAKNGADKDGVLIN